MKKGLVTTGALVGAVLSSACCWLPLLLVGLGVSTGGVAATFETYRVPLLIGTGALLLIAFYLAYRPQTTCAADGRCVEPDPRLRRFSRTMLWLSTVVVIGFATFPTWMGSVIGTAGVEQAPDQQEGVVYVVGGMHCAGCKGLLEAELMKVPGVQSATVSYEEKTAVVLMSDGKQAPDDAVAHAGEEVGFSVKRLPNSAEGDAGRQAKR